MANDDSNPTTPNAYEQRQEERKARYEELADKARRESAAAHDQASRMASVIPFGQPILVGHHSEGRDRRYRERISNTYGKSYQLSQKASYYDQRAESVGTGGISSDDPAAVVKLRAELEQHERQHALWLAINKAHKNYQRDPATLDACDLSDDIKATIRNYKPAYSWEPHPIPPYRLTNNSANMRRIRQRIEQLGQRPTETTESQVQAASLPDGVTLREDATENRVMLIFPGKPADSVRAMLKASGFKWSPTRGAWVRMLNNAGRAAAQYVLSQINKGQS